MDRNLKAIEYDKILERLAEKTSFEASRELALALEPSSGLYEARLLLQETCDAHSLSGRFGSPAFGRLHDMSGSLSRAAAGAVLTTLELMRIAALLHTIRTVTEWRGRCINVETVLDTSLELTGSLYGKERAQGFVSADFQLLRQGNEWMVRVDGREYRLAGSELC